MMNRAAMKLVLALSWMVGALFGLSTSAHAEQHALILWIGQYANPNVNLPGIDLDAKAARQIAHAMGVNDAHITELKNEQLTWKGLNKAFADLTDRIQADDKVFIYYSGHGSQKPNVSGTRKKCSEGMVAQDVQIYFDRDLEASLARLGSKASQVVMMNDSCFSGGASEKGLTSGLVAKSYPGPVGGGVAGGSAADDRSCGDAINKGFLTKNIEVVQRQGAQLLYIAASGDREVSYATPEGSLATQAWLACITQPGADKDHSGTLNGEELRACAQARIDGSKDHVSQHITLTGTPMLPVSFATGDAAMASVRVEPRQSFRDLQAGSDPAYKITLSTSKRTLRIGQDFFDFTVETKKEGFLYILQAGSDGKTFNLLFPNKVDENNFVQAGQHQFPRASWAMRSSGPAGTNLLIAVLSSKRRDFWGAMNHTGTFASAPATRGAFKDIVVVATGTNPAMAGRFGNGSQAAAGTTPVVGGRYGTSDVVSIAEEAR